MSIFAQNPAEQVGQGFSYDGMLLARQKTLQAIKDISARVTPGMLEEDAVEMAKRTLVDAGMQLSWHPTRVRLFQHYETHEGGIGAGRCAQGR